MTPEPVQLYRVTLILYNGNRINWPRLLPLGEIPCMGWPAIGYIIKPA